MLFHLKVRGSTSLTIITFSKLVSDITMLLKFTHQLFDAVSRHICSKVVISNRKSQHSSANFAIRANSLTITIYGNFAGTKFFLR